VPEASGVPKAGVARGATGEMNQRPPTGNKHPTVRRDVTSINLFLYEQWKVRGRRFACGLPFHEAIASIHVLPVDVCPYRSTPV
jgi:hypothetical protein